ncbi:DUF3443 domain-containing protein [Trinickia dinghuensis]|uniref:DUF3443 domain-containing protein n=1 Tax=Trinickia dinghuensis TaxID=2291023 RepID=A0A3D8JZP8_9BURK|nr:DUF3443 domain-containing protein [Trinickia dinghuensis]RDU98360.1 DUF3443 domain-containing protein [Trinickia dinghuensis]
MLRTHSRLVRAFGAFGIACAAVLVAACGGGGGGGGGGAGSGSGGGTGGGGSVAANQVAVTVGPGVENVANIPTVSVTVCAPGTSTCQTIPNVQVDTESFGLRLASSAMSQVLGALPRQTVAGASIAECTAFADGYTWGSVRTADVKIGGETAASLPIQIIGDMPQSAVATGACSTGSLELTPADLSANGILGIGVAPNDCGTLCANPPAGNSNYYACPGNTNCVQSVLPVAQQVANPVSKFAGDNNGVMLSMPGIGPSGQSTVNGTLTFGIGTQSDNALPGNVTKLTTNPFGDVNATFAGSSITAFFDSGSNAYFFADSTLANCAGNASSFYCPPSTVTRPVAVSSYNAASQGAPSGLVLSMAVGNAGQLLANGNFGLDDLAGSLGGANTFVDIGMPFFYGQNVYYGFDQTASGGAGPFVAF